MRKSQSVSKRLGRLNSTKGQKEPASIPKVRKNPANIQKARNSQPVSKMLKSVKQYPKDYKEPANTQNVRKNLAVS